MRSLVQPVCVLVAVVSIGCGGAQMSNDPAPRPDLLPPPDMALTTDEVCATLSQATCAKLQSCDAVALRYGYGDLETCQARHALDCKLYLGLASSSWTPLSAQKCASAFTAATCDQYLAFDATALADCYYKPGNLPNGTACGSSSQCQGGACHFTGSCGVCATAAALGEACTTSYDCAGDLACISGTCARLPSAGQTCDANIGCIAPFVCKSGVCARGATAGASCTASPDTCDSAAFCSASNVCQAFTLVHAGMACDESQGIDCDASGFCSPGPTGTCLKFAADGQPCSDTSGPYCMYPAACISGVCTIPDPGACR